jgi:hypothetical protein
MFRIASASALLLFVLVGCTGSVADGTGTSEGAATIAPAADARAQIIAGNYDGHMHGEWYGSLAIKNAAPEKFDFEFEISPDLDVAPIGRLGGTAKLQAGHYRYDDGSCTIDFQHVADEPGAQRGDLFVNASISCGVMLGIDGHSTSSTALDFTATWHRL